MLPCKSTQTIKHIWLKALSVHIYRYISDGAIHMRIVAQTQVEYKVNIYTYRYIYIYIHINIYAIR